MWHRARQGACLHGFDPGLHILLKLESFAKVGFHALLLVFTRGGVVTAVKIERCAIHMPPSWASCLDEWDGNTRIEPRLNAPDAEPTTYYYSFTVK